MTQTSLLMEAATAWSGYRRDSASKTAVQAAARVGLEIIHDSFRTSFPFHDQVNIVGAHVGSEQTPVVLGASLQQGGRPGFQAAFVSGRRAADPGSALGGNALRIFRHHTASVKIMPSINGTGYITVQVAAVASERDQVGHLDRKSDAIAVVYKILLES